MDRRSTNVATFIAGFALLGCAIVISLMMIGRPPLTAIAAAPDAIELTNDVHFSDTPSADARPLDSYDWHSADDLPAWYHTLDLNTSNPSPYVADAAADDSPQQRGQGQTRGRGRRGGRGGGMRGVYKSSINPNWFADNTKFWYRNELRGNKTEYIVVDAERGTRQPAFDQIKLATALRTAADKMEISADELPFAAIAGQPLLKFNDDATEVSFAYDGGMWTCKLAGDYEITRTGDAPAASEDNAADDAVAAPQQGRRGARGGQGREAADAAPFAAGGAHAADRFARPTASGRPRFATATCSSAVATATRPRMFNSLRMALPMSVIETCNSRRTERRSSPSASSRATISKCT